MSSKNVAEDEVSNGGQQEEVFNRVASNLRARKEDHENSGPSSSWWGVDEQTKVNLALRASQAATVPGVVMAEHDHSAKQQLSQGQLKQMGNLKRIQKMRPSERGGEQDLGTEIFKEEQPLDDFQRRMTDFRNKEDKQRTEIEELLQQGRRRMTWLLIAVTVVIIASIGTGVGVAMGSSSPVFEELVEVEAKAFHDCYMRTITHSPSERFSRLRIVMEFAWDWDSSPIDDAGSSQRAALCWLSDPASSNIEIINQTVDEVVQRFALAVVYYHFVGTSSERASGGLSASN